MLERPEPRSFTVVGIGEQRAQLDTPLLVLGPGAAWTSRNPSEAPMELVDLPGTPTDTVVRAAAENITVHGYGGVSDRTDDQERDDGAGAVRWSWVIGAVFLTVIGIVIAAAFAAGARRQLTTLGQLAANGASRVARRVLFLQGTWTGCLGAITGIALGFVSLAALRPHIDRIFWRDMGPWDVRISDLIPVVLLGVGAATVAALVPARTTSRIPVLSALSGRRPLGAVPRWLVGAGVTATVCGLGLLGLAVLGSNQPGNSANVWGLTAVVGGVAVLLGACAVAPGFVSTLEPLAVDSTGRGAWPRAASLGSGRVRVRSCPRCARRARPGRRCPP